MTFNYFQPALSQLDVTVDEISELLHIVDKSEENPIFCEVLWVYRLLPEIVEIRGGYTIFENIEIVKDEGRILFHDEESQSLVTGKNVCNYLKNAQKIAVFICSAGERFSVLSKKANYENNYLKGYIIDTFGSLIAEKSADFIQKEIQKVAEKQHLKITNRYSPGYCNWQLSNQKALFALFPENPCLISLTESNLMLPIKSVSGIIGIGNNVNHFAYKCRTCSDKDCTYRRLVVHR
ncbi:MAG: hypothetical protein LBR67_02255 [Dysgonamonadaceae bacterium]|jgi:hypothetical protein|nr:hypothetical protein [Dysgonamonadaceae bacterium]